MGRLEPELPEFCYSPGESEAEEEETPDSNKQYSRYSLCHVEPVTTAPDVSSFASFVQLVLMLLRLLLECG